MVAAAESTTASDSSSGESSPRSPAPVALRSPRAVQLQQAVACMERELRELERRWARQERRRLDRASLSAPATLSAAAAELPGTAEHDGGRQALDGGSSS